MTDYCRNKEPESSVMCGWSLVGEGTVPPVTSIALPLDVPPLMTYFLWAIVDVGIVF